MSRRSGSPSSRPTSWVTWSSWSCPPSAPTLQQHATFGVVESVKAVSDLFAPVAGEVVEANPALAGTPELVNSDPYGAGWMIKIRMSDAARARHAPGCRRVRRPDLGLTAPRCRTTAHPGRPRADAGGDRGRHRDELFADIPAASALRSARSCHLPSLSCSSLPVAGPRGRNRTDLVSFLGAGVYRHYSPALVDQLLLRGEWYAVHALPARGQPGHPPEHLRVPVAHRGADGSRRRLRLALRRGGRDRRGGADGRRATRRARVLVSRAVHPQYREVLRTYFVGLQLDEIPLVASGPPPAPPTWPRWSSCLEIRPTQWAGW